MPGNRRARSWLVAPLIVFNLFLDALARLANFIVDFGVVGIPSPSAQRVALEFKQLVAQRFALRFVCRMPRRIPRLSRRIFRVVASVATVDNGREAERADEEHGKDGHALAETDYPH
jgi:hypothetical protein